MVLSRNELTTYLASHPELQLPDPEATARIFIPMERDRLIDGLLHLILRSESNS